MEPLLRTKLFLPKPLADSIDRPQLTQRLRGVTKYRLTLISAPAGFGKTTAVTQWAHTPEAGRPPIAWLSLAESDNDPVRFWGYVTASIREALPGVGDLALAALRAGDSGAAITHLLNDLADRSLILVLDDYHAIRLDAIHDGVAELLENLPASVHLVMTTRVAPPLPLHRLRARGQMNDLGSGELRFSQTEADQFLNGSLHLGLPKDEVWSLADATEGWVTGLRLAALSHRRGSRLAGDQGHLSDYLMGEVLGALPPDLQRFLMRTSVLGRLSAELCDAVTEGSDSQVVLAHLERSNLFLVALDDRRRWFRYHHLFAEFLRSRLEEAEPALVPGLERRAAEWYAAHGEPADAIEHAVRAPDWDLAANLLNRFAQRLLLQGEVTTVLRWLHAVPSQRLLTDPDLCVLMAWALLMHRQLDAVEPYLVAAEAGGAELRGDILAIRATRASFRGDAPATLALSRETLSLYTDDIRLRAVLAMNLGHAYWLLGDRERSLASLSEAVSASRASDNLLAVVAALDYLAQHKRVTGDLNGAARLYQQALAVTTGPGGHEVPAATAAHLGLGELYYEWNDLTAAEYHLRRALALGQVTANTGLLKDAHIMLAFTLNAQGKLTEANLQMKEAERLVQPEDHPARSAWVGAYRARFDLQTGEVARAVAWADAAGTDAAPEQLALQRFGQVTLARVRLAQALPEQAVGLLDPLLSEDERAGRYGDSLEVSLLLALACAAQGRKAAARAYLQRAVTLGGRAGYIRTFTDVGGQLVPLLRAVHLGRETTPYVDRLLQAFGPEATPPAGIQSTRLVEPLSDRELEVLRLIVAGLSNQEIAAHLVVALSTVKKHVNHIFAKLGAQHRAQAIVRARDWHLI